MTAGKKLVDLVGIEPTTSSMPWKRAPNCATGPLLFSTTYEGSIRTLRSKSYRNDMFAVKSDCCNLLIGCALVFFDCFRGLEEVDDFPLAA